MSDQNMFPSDLTPDEMRLGFKIVEIENSRNRWGDDHFGEPHLLRVVACPVTESEWFFKMNGPFGIAYSRQRYGLLTKFPILQQLQPNEPYVSDLPEWQPIEDGTLPAGPHLAKALTTPSQDTAVHARIPPVVFQNGGKRYLCHPIGQIPDKYVKRYGGGELELEGRKVIGFEVVE